MNIEIHSDILELPLLQPGDNASAQLGALADWVGGNGDVLNKHLYRVGALLIRGFQVESAQNFRQLCKSITPDLRNYRGGDSPRSGVCDKVYTSTEYDSRLEVLLHNELSYAGWSPSQVYFGCIIPSETGGETPLADGRKIYARIDLGIREKFADRGVTYLQHLRDESNAGSGKSWQETFETKSKEIAEQYLRQSNMNFQWTEIGIRTAATKPAVKVHPTTHETCWHNQADQWHRDMVSVKDTVGDEAAKKSPTCGEETVGNHVVYGDNTEIEVADLNHIREVSRQCETKFLWETGDVLMIDNILSMHGRKSYTGERQILVAMS